ncbi:MAG: glycosyl transferase family 2 [Nitrospira sp.]|nr:MAG: glycosyl transferase family 2 [Nitrospira sp.]
MIRIVMPMGGEGKTFLERGYTFPKPLVEVVGRPMVEIVTHNITPKEPHEFVFICRQEHLRKFALAEVLRLLAPHSKTVALAQPTAGALCSVLLAKEHLDNDDELLIVNADQFLDVSIDQFLAEAREGTWDGFIMTFPSTHPKWSYVRLEGNHVVSVAEKRPISRNATAGVYYFRRSRDFVAAAERMLLKHATVEGEFYVCPVYNELILMGKRISVFPLSRDQMFSLGTPEDVATFSASKAVEVFGH